MKALMTKKAKLIIIHTDNRNRIGAEDFKSIVDKIELIETWGVPAVEFQNFEVRICMYQV